MACGTKNAKKRYRKVMSGNEKKFSLGSVYKRKSIASLVHRKESFLLAKVRSKKKF